MITNETDVCFLITFNSYWIVYRYFVIILFFFLKQKSKQTLLVLLVKNFNNVFFYLVINFIVFSLKVLFSEKIIAVFFVYCFSKISSFSMIRISIGFGCTCVLWFRLVVLIWSKQSAVKVDQVSIPLSVVTVEIKHSFWGNWKVDNFHTR